MIKILFVCHGNICRSPMAEFCMKNLLQKAGLAQRFSVDSAAVSYEETGNGIYPPARWQLQKEGIPFTEHHAWTVTKADYDKYDYFIGMDRSNITRMNRIFGGDPEGKISLLLDWAGISRDVADPWYTDDFQTAWNDISLGCNALLEQLSQEV